GRLCQLGYSGIVPSARLERALSTSSTSCLCQLGYEGVRTPGGIRPRNLPVLRGAPLPVGLPGHTSVRRALRPCRHPCHPLWSCQDSSPEACRCVCTGGRTRTVSLLAGTTKRHPAPGPGGWRRRVCVTRYSRHRLRRRDSIGR